MGQKQISGIAGQHTDPFGKSNQSSGQGPDQRVAMELQHFGTMESKHEVFGSKRVEALKKHEGQHGTRFREVDRGVA